MMIHKEKEERKKILIFNKSKMNNSRKIHGITKEKIPRNKVRKSIQNKKLIYFSNVFSGKSNLFPLDSLTINLTNIESFNDFQTPSPDIRETGWCFAACSKQGSFRASQEDHFQVITPIKLDSSGIIVGVYDGFMNENCSKLLSEVAIQQLNSNISKSENLEQEILNQINKIYENIFQLMKINNQLGGSTSLISIIIPKKIYIVNIGDSFACLISTKRARMLNNIHNTKNPNEEKMILENG